MGYIKQIKTNIKRGFDGELGACTLLVGDNAHGKSGIVSAVELALSGRSSEEGAIGQKLMRLVPPGEKALYVDVETDGETKVHFEVTGSTSKATKPKWLVNGHPVQGKPAVLLVSEVSAILAKSDEARRAALQEIICGEVDEGVVRRSLADALHADWKKVWEKASAKATTGPDALLAARKLIKDKLKDARAATKVELGERPRGAGEAQLADLKQNVVAARIRVDALRTGASGSGEAAALRMAQDALLSTGNALVYMGRVAAARCICCGQGLPQPVQELRALNETRLEQIRALIQAAEGASQGSQEAPGMAEALAELSVAEQALGQGQATVAAVTAWEEASASRVRAEGSIDVLKALAKAVEAAIGDSLGKSVADFEEQGSAYLPEGESLGIQLWDGKKAVCQLGLRDGDGELRTALCGAEKMRMVTAIAAAWGSRRKEPMRVVVIDDVWLGQTALAGLCEGLRHAIYEGALTQAIVCAVESSEWAMDKKLGMIQVPLTPEGWTRIDLDAQGKSVEKANGEGRVTA